MEISKSSPVIERAHLPKDLLGYYDAERHVVVVAHGLTAAQRRAVIAHELEHARHGDRPCLDPILHARRERATERASSRRLITLDALVDALLWCRDEQEMAWHLHVDTIAVRARLDGLTDEEKDQIARRIAVTEEGVA